MKEYGTYICSSYTKDFTLIGFKFTFLLLIMRAFSILSIETYILSNVIKSVNDTTLLFHTHIFIYILTLFIIETN